MPLQQGYTTEDGERKGYYRWGDSGKKYKYTPGNEQSRKRAKKKAKKQGKAIEASKHS